jgi:nitrogen fixation NifU-like protein
MISQKIVEILKNPENMGKIENPDGVGKVTLGAPHCEDEVWFYIKVEDDRIVDAKFEAFACAPALVTTSIATKLAKGKTIEEARKLSKEDIAAFIGGLPQIERECSDLGTDALKAAIEDYLKKK